MDFVFDPAYPSEQLTAEFWKEVVLLAQAEKLIRRIEEGRQRSQDFGASDHPVHE